MRATSNRLSASVERARFLGMIVATAVSRLVDEPEKMVNFDIDDMRGQEAEKWLSFVMIDDGVGDKENLHALSLKQLHQTTRTALQQRRRPDRKSSLSEKRPSATPTEHRDYLESEKDGLEPYDKPDSDPYDSEDDPTLINRSKPRAPVYIIDLIRMLEDTEDPDSVRLALETAPSLIRRKRNFGTEVSDHVLRILAALTNLKDDVETENGAALRLESFISCVSALPELTGPWLINAYFENDLSLAQRASVLSAIGLGVRDFSGHNQKISTERDTIEFPSKRLPSPLASIYSPIEDVTREIGQQSLTPLALEAADKLSGPDVVKIRKFSSRLNAEKHPTGIDQNRRTRIPKGLHKVIAEFYMLPLCGRWSMLLSATSRGHSNLLEPLNVKLTLQTLVVLYDCLGSNALQLPAVTREVLTLLLLLHNAPSLSLNALVLPVMLQLILTTLDLNTASGSIGEERLVSDFGSQLAELLTWASSLDETNTAIVATTEDRSLPWTVLLAACQVRWHEIGRKFQGRMLGLSMAEMDSLS